MSRALQLRPIRDVAADIGLAEDDIEFYGVTKAKIKLDVFRRLQETVHDVDISYGAGFLVPITGDILLMPGLPKVPAAEQADIDENGMISGLD